MRYDDDVTIMNSNDDDDASKIITIASLTFSLIV
jgi:hypothetical protein